MEGRLSVISISCHNSTTSWMLYVANPSIAQTGQGLAKVLNVLFQLHGMVGLPPVMWSWPKQIAEEHITHRTLAPNTYQCAPCVLCPVNYCCDYVPKSKTSMPLFGLGCYGVSCLWLSVVCCQGWRQLCLEHHLWDWGRIHSLQWKGWSHSTDHWTLTTGHSKS